MMTASAPLSSVSPALSCGNRDGKWEGGEWLDFGFAFGSTWGRNRKFTALHKRHVTESGIQSRVLLSLKKEHLLVQ